MSKMSAALNELKYDTADNRQVYLSSITSLLQATEQFDFSHKIKMKDTPAGIDSHCKKIVSMIFSELEKRSRYECFVHKIRIYEEMVSEWVNSHENDYDEQEKTEFILHLNKRWQIEDELSFAIENRNKEKNSCAFILSMTTRDLIERAIQVLKSEHSFHLPKTTHEISCNFISKASINLIRDQMRIAYLVQKFQEISKSNALYENHSNMKLFLFNHGIQISGESTDINMNKSDMKIVLNHLIKHFDATCSMARRNAILSTEAATLAEKIEKMKLDIVERFQARGSKMLKSIQD